MLPVLFALGPVTVSSFGFFLSLSFLYGTFLVWRLARAWDLDEEKVLDLCLLSFFGGLLGARIFFVALNFHLFSDDLTKIALITKYPGLELWGAILGGIATLYAFSKRSKKINFWQVADLAGVGILGGLILGNIGCFLGGCNVGVTSNLPIATNMVGFVGKRFPVQIIEAIAFILILRRVWPVATHFHFTGKILSLSLISIGLVELVTFPLKERVLWEMVLPVVTTAAGVFTFYFQGKRSLREDLLKLKRLNKRHALLKALKKSWYNQKTAWRWSLYQLKKRWLLALRRFRVRKTPGNI